MANRVYDPETEGEQPTYRSPPDLGTGYNRPADDASDPRGEGPDKLNQPDLRDAENSGGGFFTGGRDGAGNPASASGLLAAESRGAAKRGLSSQNDGASAYQKFMAAAKSHRKGIAIGAGTGGGIVALIIGAFFFIVPLKIEHIVTNLENRFYSSSNNAVDKETQTLFERYMTSKVLPAYKSCGTTVSKNCTPRNFGDGPVGSLYKTWSNARLENKLAENYGIEFKYERFGSGKTWVVKAPGTAPGGDPIGVDGENIAQEFDGRSSARAATSSALDNALQSETRWKKVMVRYQVGRLLDEKYGIKRCLMFCGTRDQLADKKDAKKLAAQLYITQRIITPRTQTLGIVMECLLNSCNPEDTQPTSVQDGTDGSPIDAENPETDSKARQKAQELAQKFTGASADELASEYAAASEKGFQKYLLEKVLNSVGLEAISSQAADAVPIANVVLQASNAITFAKNAGPAVQKLGYITNASAAASMFMMYRTYADEIHTGHVDPTELGSMVNSLAAGNNGPPTDPEKGGTASAEQTPLYQTIVKDGSPSQTASFINNVLPGKAYADSTSNSNSKYICENGKPVPSGKLVCNEEVLGQSNSQLDSAHQFLTSPYIQPITSAADAIHGAGNQISSVIGNIITSIPFLGGVIKSVGDMISNVLQPFFQDVINILIPNPFGTNMSGGRKFDMMAAGADVSGNDYAQTSLGGQKLNDQQLADIINEQQAREQRNFSNQSVFARMFNTDSQYSLVSKIAMSMPLGTQASAQSGLASLLNPISGLSHNFGSIMGSRASAAVSAQPDPFGVVQYGYPDGTIPNDPQKYWDDHCSDNAAQAYQNDTDYQNSGGGHGWVGEASQGSPDSNTGMPVNTTTNPCLLIKAAVGAAGGYMDTSNLTQFDLAEQSQDATSSPSSVTTPVSGNAQQLAQLILTNKNIDLTLLSSSVKQDVQDAADGKPGTAGAPVSSAILQLIATVGQNHKVGVTAIESDGQGHATGSYHYTGDAVDFGSLDGVTITGRNAPALTIIKIATQILPSGSALGQSGCGPTPSLPSGWTTFDDTCNHLHVQVPRGTP